MNGKRMEGFRFKKNYDTDRLKRALREKKKKMEREKE